MRILVLLIICCSVASCSSLPEPIPKSTPEQTQFYSRSLQACVDELTHFKRTVQQQGVQDAQLLWLPQYPHLAFDRFSLSLIPELNSYRARTQWINYVTRQAAIQRKVEYQNLPDKSAVEFKNQKYCTSMLTRATLNDESFWHWLQQTPPEYPSDYQNWQRVVGLYPISTLFAEPSIHSEKKRIIGGFVEPLHDYSVVYTVSDKPELTATDMQSWFIQAREKSALEWPQLTDEQLTSLMDFHAPEFVIESVSLDDKPGEVEYRQSDQPTVNIQKPTLYVSSSYTRFHGKTLLQLNYSLWFPNRTAKSALDPYAGKFDGILVRLTLDSHGQPYILDSIHHCGCYHMVFALDPQLRFAARNPDIEAPITLQVPPNRNANTLNITLSNGEHMIKGVRWAESTNRIRHLAVLDYQQLRSLSIQDGGNKSLFDQQGMLTASERLERFYLWPFGVKSPGAMRQIGHHATAFIGERHFDDAFMLEALFQAPPPKFLTN
ncbi:hypothetical protein MD588_08305 [Photobacterium sp. SDRW27]|uniref:hypothetical protein n=1 Tax=Photobacterium obscurum TaxID=2829490 RepID=UPI0022431AB9|nr:hypothetical protein [Photobacterium obscurum]MCW8328810.1 hypothetical protein [Photobacterium obscurum]